MKRQTIRALIVDNEQKNIDAVRERLGNQFENFGWSVSWTEATTVETGRRAITTGPPFDVVVIDLMFPRTDLPDKEESRGQELVSDAARHADTFILVISTGRDHLLNLLSDARRKGAYHATLRRDFSTESDEHSPEIIAQQIREFLIDHGTVEVCTVSSDDRDPSVQSLIHEVGKPTIIRLHEKILKSDEETDHIHLRSLTQGASGAWVCIVSADVSAVRTREHVLKLSTSQRQLRREADRGRRARQILPTRLLVDQIPAEPVGPVNDWYALAGPLVTDAVTWRRWLTDSPPIEWVSDVLETLFVDGMESAYNEVRPRPDRPTAHLSLAYHRQRRALDAIDELEAALAHPDGAGLGSMVSEITDDLAYFITEGRLIGVHAGAVPRETLITFAHGDLHGANVLVTTKGRPVPLLIDLGDFGPAHWATDPVRFAVDLVMRNVDRGADSMFFRGIESWRALMADFAEGKSDLRSMTGTAETVPALAALSWLAVNLPRFCPPLKTDADREAHRWEWHLALATYLIRSSYQPDLPPPKRCLALIAAHDQLQRTTEVLREGRG